MGDEEEEEEREREREREQIELGGEAWVFSSSLITQLAVGLFEMHVFATDTSYIQSVTSGIYTSLILLGFITSLPVLLSH